MSVMVRVGGAAKACPSESNINNASMLMRRNMVATLCQFQIKDDIKTARIEATKAYK
jgi:hypothetical protein